MLVRHASFGLVVALAATAGIAVAGDIEKMLLEVTDVAPVSATAAAPDSIESPKAAETTPADEPRPATAEKTAVPAAPAMALFAPAARRQNFILKRCCRMWWPGWKPPPRRSLIMTV